MNAAGPPENPDIYSNPPACGQSIRTDGYSPSASGHSPAISPTTRR